MSYMGKRKKYRSKVLPEGRFHAYMYFPKGIFGASYIQEAFENSSFIAIPRTSGEREISISLPGRRKSWLQFDFIRRLKINQEREYPRIHIQVHHVEIRSKDGKDYGKLYLNAHVDEEKHLPFPSNPKGKNKKLAKREIRRLLRNIKDYSFQTTCLD